ncbi:mannose-1-phosphate guanylyltransferase [Pectinatus haikarae]|uniref:Mannose-1-phosphate guanylyltransferase/mannose-6-phosphate isomerase n=1 Tax=Pectinatus haikarae TaxID=349096 RepID=A0ABT9YAT0_9FIRM|nr:mannose-1-phosphate guanylyltransferase [Pectinatus haikarae]MDQ0204312.1 mannose-1-phosphate guanylyltransferase/mannose-6-phosphate isomerase [Pectinatus haikarae]
MKIIILAGGNGSRLFPLSNDNSPKQFLKINSKKSLLAETINRFSDIVVPKDIIVVTAERYANFVKEEAAICNAEEIHIITEPIKKNTAPAIILAAKYCQEILKCPEDEILFISPSDHIIQPQSAFNQAVLKAVEYASKGSFVTFGIQPNKPETGYGYIEIGQNLNGVYTIKAFKEKPDLLTAENYLLSGKYFWNSGMFAFTCKTYFSEISHYLPEIKGILNNNYIGILNNFARMPNLSIDYAVAEKSKLGMMIPLSLYWNDVGSWDSVYDILPKDENGNVSSGPAITIDCNNNLFFCPQNIIASIGINDIIVVADKDVILLAHKGEGQSIRKLAKKFENKNYKA